MRCSNSVQSSNVTIHRSRLNSLLPKGCRNKRYKNLPVVMHCNLRSLDAMPDKALYPI